MTRMSRVGGCLAVLLAGTLARAQQPPQTPATPDPIPVQTQLPEFAPEGTVTETMPGTLGVEQESQPYQQLLDIAGVPQPPRWGPMPVDQVGLLRNALGIGPWLDDRNLRMFGWIETGYTGSSSGAGLQATQPRLNRFGNEFLVNELGFVVQKSLKQDQFDWGFNVRYFAGANAAVGTPKGGIGDPVENPRFGQDLRDAYLSVHLPILTEGGMNVKVGRMNTIIGWNGFLAPYRPLYSSDYQFFYSQDGAFTGFLTQLVVSDRMDIWNGMTLGANTFFETRSANSYCYIGQINYWLQSDKRTRLTASTYLGPDAIFAAPGMNGDFVSMVELRAQHTWGERFTQVIQSNFGWDRNTPVGTASWFGVYGLGILHLTREWDFISRAEWFRDVGGTRTGVNAHFSEVTFGLNWHPTPFIEIRPEIRGDFASRPAFGRNNLPTDYTQLSGAISALFKF